MKNFKDLAINERMLIARLASGDTQKELAVKIDIHSSVIGRLEKGQRGIPVRHLRKVLDYIDSVISVVDEAHLDEITEAILNREVA